jgi:NodT family efflux transporter outer membrane factor (OMF) lipoprotein
MPKAELAAPAPLQARSWSGGDIAAPGQIRKLADAFGSPELAVYVQRAQAANPDLAAAMARVQRARAGLRAARAQAEPIVASSIGAGAYRRDEGSSSQSGLSGVSAGLNISWEADLFGRLAAGRTAERARVAAAMFDADAMAVALEGEIARAFVRHAVIGARLGLLDQNLATARELERIIGVRLRLGAATRVETGLLSTGVRQLEVERTRLAEAQRRTRNALAVLVGDEAPLFAAPLTELSELTIPAVATVQPSELLVRRADLQAAEARIAAASGDVEAARRAFLPRLRLSAAGLGEAALTGGPIAATAAIGADLLASIFGRGALHARLDQAAGSQQEIVALYRGLLIRALGEAEDALTGAEQSGRRVELLDQALEEARVTARLAQTQYLAGYADLQRVLEAQERLISFEDARLIASQERFEASIDLYRAMGGAFVLRPAGSPIR